MDAMEAHAYDVKVIHNVLRRSLAQLVQHAQDKGQSEKQFSSFLGFLRAFLELLHAHHHHEDAIMFPFFKAKGMDFDQEFEDHKALDSLMADLASLSTLEDLAQFPRDTCHAKLVALRDLMGPHLDSEEQKITPANMRSAGLTEAEVKAMDEQVQKEAQKADGTLILPLIYYHLDKEERKRFWARMFPWAFRRIIFPFVIKKKHASYWQYSMYYAPRAVAASS